MEDDPRHRNPPLMLHTTSILADVSSEWLLEPPQRLLAAPFELVEGLSPKDGRTLGQLRGRVSKNLYDSERYLAVFRFLQTFEDAPGIDGRSALTRLKAFYEAAIDWSLSMVVFLTLPEAGADDLFSEPPAGSEFRKLVELAQHRHDIGASEVLAVAFGVAEAAFDDAGLEGAVKTGRVSFDLIRARLTGEARRYAPSADSLYGRNAIGFASRLVLNPYPLRASWAEREVSRLVSDAFAADRTEALAIVQDHSDHAPSGVLETARRLEENLEREDYLAANRLLAEGVLRPFALQSVRLEAVARGLPASGLTAESDLGEFETHLSASALPVHRQLAEQIRRTVRNADAHGTAHRLIDGRIRLTTRDGVEEVSQIGLEMTYWQLRSMLDGFDTTLETAVIAEVGLKRPAGYQPRVTTVGESLIVIRLLASDHGLAVSTVEHDGSRLTAFLSGTATQQQLQLLAASIVRAFHGEVSPVELVNREQGWTYRCERTTDAT